MAKEIIELLETEINYFKKLKFAIGDLHGHIHSLAVKSAKFYLANKFPDIKDWKVSEKFDPGIDIVAKSKGRMIVAAEIKTTFRSEKKTLGSQQKDEIKKDIFRLRSSRAPHQFLFVIDDKNEQAINRILRSSPRNRIKLVNILDKTGKKGTSA